VAHAPLARGPCCERGNSPAGSVNRATARQRPSGRGAQAVRAAVPPKRAGGVYGCSTVGRIRRAAAGRFRGGWRVAGAPSGSPTHAIPRLASINAIGAEIGQMDSGFPRQPSADGAMRCVPRRRTSIRAPAAVAQNRHKSDEKIQNRIRNPIARILFHGSQLRRLPRPCVIEEQ
jgi:hypothetical protein